MPRSFDMATEYQGTVTQVHDALCDRAGRAWLATMPTPSRWPPPPSAPGGAP